MLPCNEKIVDYMYVFVLCEGYVNLAGVFCDSYRLSLVVACSIFFSFVVISK